jgi:MoxR-like ATPase
MLEIRVGYPTRSEEEAIVEQTTGSAREKLQQVLEADTVRAMQQLVRRIPVSKQLVRAAVTLARQTRPGEPDSPALVKEYVEWGAGPRASQYLVLGAKARAAMDGRPMADLEDVRLVAPSVLRHRVVTNFAAEAAGRTSDDLVRELVARDEWMR